MSRTTSKKADLGDHLSGVPEIATTTSVRLCEKVFDESHPNIVPHLVKLLVDLGIVVVVVGAELGYDSPIGERDELRIDLFDSRPNPISFHHC